MKDWFTQIQADVRLEWGHDGARRAAERGDVLVVVDVLSFSTLIATGVANGASIYPFATQDEAEACARQIGGEVAVHRRDVPIKGRYSLSPVTLFDAPAGLKLAVASPNGATCARYARTAPCLIAGALVNATAAAQLAAAASIRFARPITVLACGERWEAAGEDGTLRFALEDYLGAGAIIAALPEGQKRSAEARAAQAAFTGLQESLAEAIRGCGSGIELIERGFSMDVEHAVQWNRYAIAPVLRQDVAFAWFHAGGNENI